MAEIIHPSHYNQGGIECIEAIKAAVCNIKDPFEAYCTGAILKYAWRWDYKNGIEDLEKAKQYIDFIIAYRADKPVTVIPATEEFDMGEEDVSEPEDGKEELFKPVGETNKTVPYSPKCAGTGETGISSKPDPNIRAYGSCVCPNRELGIAVEHGPGEYEGISNLGISRLICGLGMCSACNSERKSDCPLLKDCDCSLSAIEKNRMGIIAYLKNEIVEEPPKD